MTYLTSEMHPVDTSGRSNPVCDADGTQRWYQDGRLHRLDGPAVLSADGSVWKWYKDGMQHRENGPGESDGRYLYYFFDGKLHREDGPVMESLGEKCEQFFFLHGKPFLIDDYLSALEVTDAEKVHLKMIWG